MNQKGNTRLILHLHELHLKAQLQPFNLKFVIFQGQQNTQTKLESRKQILLTNHRADIEEAFELNHVKDGKILMIILKTKLKQTSFLGQISIDTNRYVQQGLETINLESAISKCSERDDNARLLLTLTFHKKQPLREFEIQRVMNKQHKEHKEHTHKQIKPSIITSTESVVSKSESQSTIKAERPRKVSTDFYKKNYKNLQILREDKKDKERDSKSKERSGSYKKRFEYQANTLTNKGKNTIVFMKQKKEKLKEKEKKVEEQVPMARDRTPEPIRLDRLSYASQSKSKPASKHSSIRPRQATERSAEKHEKMRISIHAKTQRYETQSEPVDHEQHTFSKGSSNKSIAEEDKYKNFTDKLKSINMKIEDKKSVERSSHSQSKQSKSQSQSKSKSKEEQNVENRDSVCTFGDVVKISHEGDIPTVSHLKIMELEEKILKLQQKIHTVEKEKEEKDILLQKISSQFEKSAQEIDSIREGYEKQISSLQQELTRSKKPRNNMTPVESELKNQKRKVLNLENSLLLKENEIKHFKLSINLLQEERHQLQTMLAKKEYKMGQNSSRAILEAQMMASGYPSAVKSENELLRSENQLLKKYIDQLNELVEQYELQNSRAVNKIKEKEVEDLRMMVEVLNKNIKVQEKIAEKLQTELRRTKLNFAVIMNVMFEKGGQELVEIVEKQIMERNSGYSSDS